VVICGYEIVHEILCKSANVSSNRKADSMPKHHSEIAEATPGKK